jgi:protein tyrosine phosphatase (PTP) superfamily phosphohydrolase (DUF442 family)
VPSSTVSVALSSVLGLLALTSCQTQRTENVQTTRPAATAPATEAPATRVAGIAGASTQPSPFIAINNPNLINAFRITDKVISGAQPEGDAGFAALRDLGVKTIITVDGSKPDVATAHKFGMKYVHIPIRYDTVERADGLAIAEAIDEMPGQIYLHCHHGKHRSAAAAAVACVFNGDIPASEGEMVLQTMGTGKNYTGLWAAAREAKPVDPAIIKNLHTKFVETKQIPPLADAMVFIDQTFDHLKLIQKSGWKAPTSHPDLDPPHEALQLMEHFHEVARTDEAKAHPADFQQYLADAESAAEALQLALRITPTNPTINKPVADGLMKKMGVTCNSCHSVYRN